MTMQYVLEGADGNLGMLFYNVELQSWGVETDDEGIAQVIDKVYEVGGVPKRGSEVRPGGIIDTVVLLPPTHPEFVETLRDYLGKYDVVDIYLQGEEKEE